MNVKGLARMSQLQFMPKLTTLTIFENISSQYPVKIISTKHVLVIERLNF